VSGTAGSFVAGNPLVYAQSLATSPGRGREQRAALADPLVKLIAVALDDRKRRSDLRQLES
jgi:hypothetical protein